MMEPTLGHIWEALSDYVATGDEPVLSSVVIDSREAVPGALFVALAGERTDGHEFVGSAFEQGAIAALVERTPVHDIPVINLRDEGSAAIPRWDGTLPLFILVEDSLVALQEAARFWRAQFDVQVIGITGSVGNPQPRNWPLQCSHSATGRLSHQAIEIALLDCHRLFSICVLSTSAQSLKWACIPLVKSSAFVK